MSGGFFEYKQYQIDQIAEELERRIEKAKNKEEGDFGYSYEEPDRVIEKLEEILYNLKRAAIMAQRADWYLSGDDGEDSFFRRLEEDLEELHSQSDNKWTRFSNKLIKDHPDLYENILDADRSLTDDMKEKLEAFKNFSSLFQKSNKILLKKIERLEMDNRVKDLEIQSLKQKND
jgi:hypothetical protein